MPPDESSREQEKVSHGDIMDAIHAMRFDIQSGLMKAEASVVTLSNQMERLTQSLDRNWTATDEHGKQLTALNVQHEIEERQRQAQNLRETQAVRQEAHEHYGHIENGIVIPPSVIKVVAIAAMSVLMLVLVIATLVGVNVPFM